MTTPGPYVPEPHRKTDQQNTPVEPSDNGEPQFSKESIDNERDPFGRNEEIPGDSAKEKPLRPMPSWIEYGNRDIDRSQYHVGEGFLEIGGFVMLIGQSYVGKSTLLAQISVNVAIGRTWLFFKVERPLRILMV